MFSKSNFPPPLNFELPRVDCTYTTHCACGRIRLCVITMMYPSHGRLYTAKVPRINHGVRASRRHRVGTRTAADRSPPDPVRRHALTRASRKRSGFCSEPSKRRLRSVEQPVCDSFLLTRNEKRSRFSRLPFCEGRVGLERARGDRNNGQAELRRARRDKTREV